MEDTLDMHGTRHIDALRIISNFIDGHIVEGTREVKIITGHSEGMKRFVHEVAESYDCKATEAIGNPGMLIVDMT